MKKLFAILFAILLAMNVLAQAPEKMSYQAVIRDVNNALVANTIVGMQISILQSTPNGKIVYVETQYPTTNANGLISIEIGGALGFDTINWSTGTYFIKTETDPTGGSNYTITGTSQLLSVPYALYAKTSGNDILSKTNPDKVYLKDTNSNFGIGTTTPTNKLEVKADATNGIDQAIFNVINSDGDTVFAVYPQGVRINVLDDPTLKAKSKKGGFAVGGYKPSKGTSQELLHVSSDSVRIYIDDATGGKAPSKKGGFAIGGYKPAKGISNEYLSVNTDSIKASKSFLLPRLSSFERDNLGFTPSDALIIFNTSDECMQIYKNGVWSNIWCFNCAPSFIIQPLNHIICSGENTDFFVSLTGTSISYQWQVSTDGGNNWTNVSNNSIYAGATTYKLSLTNIPVSFDDYKYRCNVTASCPPSVTSEIATLNVGSTPSVISVQPTNQILSIGCVANFNVTSPGYGLTYKWQQSADGITFTDISNGGTSPIFSGATSNSLSLSNVDLTYDNYKFRCVISNNCGVDVVSNVVSLNVNTNNPITVQPVDYSSTTVSANFNVSVSGVGVIYQWQESIDNGINWSNVSNGGSYPNYSGSTSNSFSLSNIPLTYDKYKYRCIVRSLCQNEFISNVAILNVAIPNFEFNGTLYVHPTDNSTGIIWQNTTNVNTGGTSLTDGEANTLAIIASAGAEACAAQICADLNSLGYDDWFLPAKDELNAMYSSKSAIGGFSNTSYWSSTEAYAYLAWRQDFTNAYQGSANKLAVWRVRCVRR